MNTTGLPQYQSHKKVWAAHIVSTEVCRRTCPECGDPATYEQNQGFDDRYICERCGVISAKEPNLILHTALPDRPEIRVKRAWVIKHQPTPTGYYVLYPDGYESFSPAKAFEEGYFQLPTDHKTRVRLESAELDARRNRLTTFIGGKTFSTLDELERSRLNRQLEAMTLYSNILKERIAAFTT